jgi:rhodanese-related sulfurtransferase
MIIIDVRESNEYDRGHVEGAINIPASKLSPDNQQLQKIPKDEELILYCVTGSRSNLAINILRDMGYTNLTNGINKYHVEASLAKD